MATSDQANIPDPTGSPSDPSPELPRLPPAVSEAGRRQVTALISRIRNRLAAEPTGLPIIITNARAYFAGMDRYVDELLKALDLEAPPLTPPTMLDWPPYPLAAAEASDTRWFSADGDGRPLEMTIETTLHPIGKLTYPLSPLTNALWCDIELRTGDILMLGRGKKQAQEHVLVTAAPADCDYVVLVERGYGNTTKSGWRKGQRVEIIGFKPPVEP